MKKYLLLGTVLALFGVFVLLRQGMGQDAALLNATPITPNSSGSTGGSTGSSNSGSGSSTGQNNSSGGSTTYKDGIYTGQAADAFYGTVQVQAVISGGKITDVQFLQYPNAGGHTSEVSSIALPALKQEAIQAQSANVDSVSGASATSQAFQQSLVSALSQAH